MADEEIAALKISMENACVADNKAREEGKPAIEKLKLLPKVVAMMNRNAIQHAILDPETNFLQSLRFFLEPLNDGSLPAYNIQREIFTALLRLPVEKEALLSSGIGKVVLFYTKSKRPEPGVKRMAEKLIGEWSRPILKRTDDFRKRHIETREFDYAYVMPLPSMSSTPRLSLCHKHSFFLFLYLLCFSLIRPPTVPRSKPKKQLPTAAHRRQRCPRALPAAPSSRRKSKRSWRPRIRTGLPAQVCKRLILSLPKVPTMLLAAVITVQWDQAA